MVKWLNGGTALPSGFVASNVSSIICFSSRGTLAIGDVLGGSHDGQRRWSRGNAKGDRLACAQKKLEPTHVRLLRRIGGLRSIECEFDHLFLVDARWTTRHDLPGSQIAKEPLARGDALGVLARLARRKNESRLTSGCYGNRVCVASKVSSIICFWSRGTLAIGDVLGGSHDGQRRWSRGNAQGDRLACAQKK
jgi:hypothetical protein